MIPREGEILIKDVNTKWMVPGANVILSCTQIFLLVPFQRANKIQPSVLGTVHASLILVVLAVRSLNDWHYHPWQLFSNRHLCKELGNILKSWHLSGLPTLTKPGNPGSPQHLRFKNRNALVHNTNLILFITQSLIVDMKKYFGCR